MNVSNTEKHLAVFLEVRERIFWNWCVDPRVPMEFTRTFEVFSKNLIGKIKKVVLNKVILLEMMKSIENVEFLELGLSVKHDFKQSEYVKPRILLLPYFSSSSFILLRKFLSFLKAVLYTLISKIVNTLLFWIQILFFIVRSFVILFICCRHNIKNLQYITRIN